MSAGLAENGELHVYERLQTCKLFGGGKLVTCCYFSMLACQLSKLVNL